jgi:hypothetical protein
VALLRIARPVLVGVVASVAILATTAPALGKGPGLAIAATSDGWSGIEAPLPAGQAPKAPDVSLDKVACGSATSCVAVGDYFPAKNRLDGLIEVWNGRSWRPVEVPVPAGAAADPQVKLETVACPSATRCVAGGTYNTSPTTSAPLLVVGSGKSWTSLTPPVPAGSGTGNAGILDVTCRSASACIAVGYDATDEAIIETGSGTSWKVIAAPEPANGQAESESLFDVACGHGPAALCVAVGDYTDTSGATDGVAISGSGSSWHAAETPLPANAERAGQFVELFADACPSARTCVAVGFYTDKSGNNDGVMLTGSQTKWQVAKVSGDWALEIACPSASSCVAATATALVTGHGTSWKYTRAPDFDAAGTPILLSVACASSKYCVVTGIDQENASGEPFREYGLLDVKSGTSWKSVKAPFPANAHAGDIANIDDVACPSAKTCVAAGSYNGTVPQDGWLLTRRIRSSR